MKCKSCGEKINKKTEICPSCDNTTIDSNHKPKKKKLKPFVIVIISVVGAFVFAFAVMSIFAIIDIIQENKVEIAINDSSILNYYEEIREDISDESYSNLIMLYKKYGMMVEFPKTNKDSFDRKSTALEKDQYDLAIKSISNGLKGFGDDEETIKYIDLCLNKINCYSFIEENNGKRYGSLSSADNNSIKISLNSEDTYEKENIMEKLSFYLGFYISDRYNLNSLEFASYNTNGFLNYDNEIVEEKHYDKILDSQNISSKLTEYKKAGFLDTRSVESIDYDFCYYVSGLFTNSENFWYDYSKFPAIYEKANKVIFILEKENPAWNLEQIIEISHPDGLSALKEIQNTNNDSEKTIKEVQEINFTKYLGLWKGTYHNNSGAMNLDLDIIKIDENTGETTALFSFSPSKDNEDGKSGAFMMTGFIDVDKNTLTLVGDEWVSEQPKGYNKLDLNGEFVENYLKGNLDRDDMKNFLLEKQ